MFQWETTEVEREDAHQNICDFVYDFEVLYVQGKVARFHFVPQCMHAISHTPFETFRIGSLICTAQFTMERTIGDLGGEIRQPSNPFANLAERALRRARDNALKAMIPDLDAAPPPKVPVVELGDGYTLLHAREDRARPVGDHEDMVVFRYLEGLVGTEQARQIWVLDMKTSVQRWARLRLPNQQVCRTSWKEVENNMTRISRNVKVCVSSTGDLRRMNFLLTTMHSSGLNSQARQKLILLHMVMRRYTTTFAATQEPRHAPSQWFRSTDHQTRHFSTSRPGWYMHVICHSLRVRGWQYLMSRTS